MDNSTFQKIQDLLSTHETIGVVVGQNPTVDDMGAALSLYLHITSLGKKTTIASPTDPIVEISSLVGIDRVKNNLDGDGGDLIVSFPYRDNEIQKVSYTIEDGFLNIVVKAGENGLTFGESDVRYRRGGGVPTLLFVVGTPRLSDLGSIFNPEKLKDTVVVNVDNKRDNQGFGDVVLVSTNFSSVSEQMARLLSYLNPDLDTDIAQNLLSGISYATDNFQSPQTSYLAFEMASVLLKRGAQRTGVQVASRPQQAPVLEEGSFMQPVAQSVRPVLQQPQQRGQQRRDQQRNQQPQQQNQAQPQKRDDPSSQGSSGQAVQVQGKKPEEKKQTPDWLMPKVYKGPTNI